MDGSNSIIDRFIVFEVHLLWEIQFSRVLGIGRVYYKNKNIQDLSICWGGGSIGKFYPKILIGLWGVFYRIA